MINAGLLAITLYCFVLLGNPPVMSGNTTHKANSPSTRPTESNLSLAPLNQFQALCNRDWRGPLFDPKVEVKAAPPPQFNATLVGTVVEPGFTYGIFKTNRGESTLVSVGQEIEQAQLKEIEDGKAVLEFHGKPLTLYVEAKE